MKIIKEAMKYTLKPFQQKPSLGEVREHAAELFGRRVKRVTYIGDENLPQHTGSYQPSLYFLVEMEAPQPSK